MAIPPYNRSFNAGHQSELLLNAELHKLYKTAEHLLDETSADETPEGELDGSLWLKRPGDELKTYHKKTNTWHNVFGSKFQIVDQITDDTTPDDPVKGQLWLCQGVLLYFDGSTWQPIKALTQSTLQDYLVGVNDFALVSPMNPVETGLGARTLLIPDVDTDRLFSGENTNISLVHVAPSRLVKIVKRLFAINKDNPVIAMESKNTEFYGYFDYYPEGDFLIPKVSGSSQRNEIYDYEVLDDGIYLTDETAANYDYILAVTYNFEWMRSAGTLKVTDNNSENVRLATDDDKINSKASEFEFNIFENSMVQTVMTVDYADETMVYKNKKLMCNDVAVMSKISKEKSLTTKYISDYRDGEIRCFIDREETLTDDTCNGAYYSWDSKIQNWIPVNTNRISGIRIITGSYKNFGDKIKCKFGVTNDDSVRVYGFKYAGTSHESPIIKNILLTPDNSKPEGIEIPVPEGFIPTENSLSVYVNGIRQYEVEEHIDGISFKLPSNTSGIVTYVIEKPQKNFKKLAEREILDERNVASESINVYKTEMSLYPGRVVLFIDGLRQPQRVFTVLDNHTILIDTDQALIGHKKNFPLEKISNGKSEILHNMADRILVEVKHDYTKQEAEIFLDHLENSCLNLSNYPSLDEQLLKTSEEIFFYVNGLFTGMKLNDDYFQDMYRGSLVFKNSNFIEKLNSNFLDTVVNSNDSIKSRYFLLNGGKKHERPTNEIIIEWRSGG